MGASAPQLLGTVPIPRTRLIGRETELASARAFLLDAAVPLLALTGPGGVGKTRLALAIAQNVADQFRDGVVFIDLAPLTDPTLVPATVASLLGVIPVSDQSLTEALVAALRRDQQFLILDNCEHVLAAAAELVTALLSGCPALQVLATSRATLHIRGEQTLLVAPLPVPEDEPVSPSEPLAHNDAVALFVERARAIRPGFAMTDINAAAIAAICRQLDGLPLAIELAAARLRILSVDALLAQMSDRLQLLQGGPRDLPARQQTLQNTVAWSYGLLSGEDQRLFRRLSVFAGGWTLEAAAAVGELSLNDALLRLECLCDQSLVRVVEREGEQRLTMLETIRAFGWERLTESGDEPAARDRHAAYFEELTAQAAPEIELGRVSTGWFARLDEERDNIRAALTWRIEQGAAERAQRLAGAMAEYWAVRGDLREGQAWCERALGLDAADLSARARVLYGIALIGHFGGNIAGSIAAAQQSIEVAEAGEDPRDRVRAHLALAFAWRSQKNGGLALEHAQAAAALARQIGDSGQLAWALSEIGQNPLSLDAEARTEEALALFRDLSSEGGEVYTLDILAGLAARRGNVRLAAQYYQEGLTIRQGIGDRLGIIDILIGTAALTVARGQPEAAVHLLAAGVAHATELNYAKDLTYAKDFSVAPAPRDIVALAQRQLSIARFDEAWRQGASLTPRDAAGLAEALLTWLTSEALAENSIAPPHGIASCPPPPRPTFHLTRREHEVLALLCQRLTDPEIAERLSISPRTASGHVANVLGKLGASSRREVTAIAASHGFV